ncbi:hypothetical protein SteCoe_7933 [Stentor coeruleus]|uniref:Uncharacterized protein n=1 Tax=Stentor coeruleus TaxID=5963 RepID=A0A1R2CLI6_9CILI|nr:hypothetical protein SteCoe_7933 [Stentor coeruleus]
MEAGKTFEGDNTDESAYSDADLTSHLRDKIRQQASRLRALEQYRVICEKRIQELQPGHPLPIKKDHLGISLSQSVNPTKLSHELQLAHEKIARLENQLSQKSLDTEDPKEPNEYMILLEKYNDMLKDKNDLEESLRAEMLNCEEQRTYIELLKQTIEGKLEEIDGISLDPKALSMMNSSRSKTDESRRETSRMKNTILDYESQIKRFQNQIRNKENENEMLVRERAELDSHLRQAAEALQIAEEEVAKLEEEKVQLLEYVEQHTTKEREMERELNELSKYFEEMKKDFHETLTSLEGYKAIQNKQEAEIEVYKEELFKNSQVIREYQENIENLKKQVTEKEVLVRNTKEEKINAEIKIEKLQANVESLTESLKETQLDTSKLQENLDSLSKNESQKSENYYKLKNENTSLYQENTLIKEKISMVQKELESERRSKTDLERIRELDIKQLQEFKSKMLDYQAKCEILEGIKRTRNENDLNRKNDVIRISQLEEELMYMQDSVREIQQRESMQSQALNEAKIANAKLTNEIEELYLENENLRIEMSKKTKELDLYLSKFSHLNEFCETIETDKAELEEFLMMEKNNIKDLKEQALNDKMKIDEMTRAASEFGKIRERLEKSLYEKEEEMKNVKQQFKAVERELEEEKSVKNKGSNEIKDLTNKIQIQDYEIEKMTCEIANCCKLISAFCGKFTIVYNDYRSCVSVKYKEYLDNWKEGSGSNLENINSWITSTIEELENLSKSLFQSNKQVKIATSELHKLQVRCEESNSGEVIYKQHALKLKAELDELYQKNENILEKSEDEINNLRYEINNLKREIVSLNSEKFSLSESLKNAMAEYQNLKFANELSRKSIKTAEAMDTERKIYSKEMMMKQVQKDLNIGERQRTSFETLRNKIEPEGNLENIRDKIRKNIICTQDHNPNTCPYLHLSEKSFSSKPKSQFS